MCRSSLLWSLLGALVGCVGTPGMAVVPALAEPLDSAEADRAAQAGHSRLTTARGPVHVWTPPGYEPATAGILLYVHGYYTDVDTAWRDHRLPEQFLHSRRNALFIAPEAPTSDAAQVFWSELPALLDVVAKHTELPGGPVVAVAHSGGFRTVVPWLASGLLDSVILLDGLYANEAQFGQWLDAGGNRPRSLVLAGAATTARTERFLVPLGDALVRDQIPDRPEPSLRAERARVLFFRSQYGHMELVTEGRAIPSLLRLTELRRVGQQG